MANYSDQEKLGHLYGWYVYIVTVPGFTKIGTAANIKYRVCGLQNGNPVPLTLIAAFKFSSRSDAMTAERAVLKLPAVNRIGNRDWCACSPDIVTTLLRDACTYLKIAFTELDAGEALK